ncbi:MAG: hypothetical protein JWO92_1964 [Chitinophagaceae bacterium]|nr:hypothetical protein [Chitinophagaceae bacterium]MDB5223630.1 hypothetical protein [Chitinophagaceae bacterium]
MQPTSKKTVMRMRDEYEKTIRKSSTENLKKRFPDRPWIEEASSTWVSRKELEELLNANNADGLRIYYGCHFQSTHSNPKNDYHGLHNLIFVATKDSVDTQNPTTETSVDQLRDVTVTGDPNAEPTSYADAGGEFTVLCPPSCPTPP